MESMYRRALDAAGYNHVRATEKNVRECFKDYVDAGYWSNLEFDDVDELTTEEIYRALIKLNKGC